MKTKLTVSTLLTSCVVLGWSSCGKGRVAAERVGKVNEVENFYMEFKKMRSFAGY